MTPAGLHRHRRASLVLVLVMALGLIAPFSGRAFAQESAPAGESSPAAQESAPEKDQPAAAKEKAEEAHEASAAEEDHDSWGPTIAKAVNFAALVAVLVYFLRAPIVDYLRTRSETIRKDLVDAASLRAAAEQQLAEVRARLSALPAELDALKRRGQDELAAERVRLADATAREKAHVIERTQREIDTQFRVARRNLTEHAAELAMTLARARVARDITPADQSRLIERYASEVRA